MIFQESDYHPYDFANRRHIGPSPSEIAAMLDVVGAPSLEALIDETVPAAIRQAEALDWGAALSEQAVLHRLRATAARNKVLTSLIGQGYYGTVTPPVIQRNIFENPAWYTAYTPYQPEISQGRLEALLNFQTMVCDLTGLDVANASLLDEATAAAEAMALCQRAARSKAAAFFVDRHCHPQTIDVIRTRAEPYGWEVVVGDPFADLEPGAVFGAVFQYPGTYGDVQDFAGPIAALHAAGALACVAADPLALTLLKPPGEMGADIAVGSTQRFGVPLGYGGPHAAYMAVQGRAEAVDAGADRRGVDRRAREPGVPAGLADARAAHPAGEGDLERLHGAGAAGGDGVDVCGVPRAGGAEGHRPAHPPQDGAAGEGAGEPRVRGGAGGVLRHRHGARSGRCRG